VPPPMDPPAPPAIENGEHPPEPTMNEPFMVLATRGEMLASRKPGVMPPPPFADAFKGLMRPPSPGSPGSPDSPALGDSLRKVPAAILDTAPAKKKRDAWKELLSNLDQIHTTEVAELNKEIRSLQDRMNAVLMSNWSTGDGQKDGSVVEGSPYAPLHLVTGLPTGKDEHGGEIENLWTVTEDDRIAKSMGEAPAFLLRTAWKQVKEDLPLQAELEDHLDDKRLSHQMSHIMDEVEEVEGSGRCGKILRRVLCTPDSPRRLVWDVCSALLLFYDIIVIPLGAFNLEESSFLVAMDWLTLLFWTCDVGWSFCTGFIQGGVTIMHPTKIALQYLGGWFWLDLIVILPDWGFTLYGAINSAETSGAGDSAGILRAIRVVRVVRLLRLAKLRKLLQMLKDNITSEKAFVAMYILQLLFLLVFVNHFLGSAWYAIGDYGKSQKGPNWITADGFATESLFSRYAVSFEWSLSHFALGSINTMPTNVGERAFAIPVLLFGMLMFSLMTAAVTSSIMRLQSSSSEQTRQLWLLRRYLTQNNVPSNVVVKVAVLGVQRKAF